jgi:hypothetical protein
MTEMTLDELCTKAEGTLCEIEAHLENPGEVGPQTILEDLRDLANMLTNAIYMIAHIKRCPTIRAEQKVCPDANDPEIIRESREYPF